ncbi:hypothetical protein CPLU01_09805 [Colletotrichum plurivorum]|uniref:Uncharacterized protein n=1 Tax=Colletotrichum plurivorum TaxID=2175906 RepID=A0A8H6NA98_9PEZI|nr:hypothetical protein CPLU01_09805 [Colletotrichum plurivorum]
MLFLQLQGVLAGMTGAILRGVPGTNQWEVQAVVAVASLAKREKIPPGQGPGKDGSASSRCAAQCRPTESDCAANRTHFASHQRGLDPQDPYLDTTPMVQSPGQRAGGRRPEDWAGLDVRQALPSDFSEL